MAFRIREITVHLSSGQCMPASPDPLCPTPTKPPVEPPPPCIGKTKKPHPQDVPPSGPRKRSLDLLQARLREVMATL